jgi:hypothetical protein
MPSRPAAPQAAPSMPDAQTQRSELIKQYEAMRKQAMEEAQKRWQQYYGNRAPAMPQGMPPMPMYPAYPPRPATAAPAAEAGE